ncbi:glutamate--tRNA ligase [Thiospirochaeta perfilievii]|uniref:Glutamate--tRNA ligase n=1 Tax=Thiospirochaeta perfilievii TaxID=252967 RepID=A0A5C1QEX0_9SPIO|nr:glutamate--tRNA ligase [Thiospirochaeta perfilievii]QEN05947.1 glutamate--tRNA ligase [Thiospirochaeta perfilievii]
MEVRVRYAPSPTGLQHIGSVRTALFNYFFAKANGGKFILRVEDTDRTRYSDEALEDLYNTFKWLGVEFDESPEKGGEYGPYVQSERTELYREYAQKLVESGKAYYCYCTEERLNELREYQQANKLDPGYDRKCQHISDEEKQRLIDQGVKPVLRLKIPTEGKTSFDDIVLGKITRKNKDVMVDPILMKGDGFPTYHLANVIDDHLMKITHILRAQEWIPTGPVHVMLYEAFGWEPPKYAHLPNVNGKDGKKLSKRHGSTSIKQFIDGGYIPEGLINYVTLVGWSYDDKREFFTKEEFEQLFTLDKISKSPGIFDYKKLDWFNGQYLRKLEDSKLEELLIPILESSGVVSNPITQQERDIFIGAMPIFRERLVLTTDIVECINFLYNDIEEYDLDILIPKKMEKEDVAKVLETTIPLLEDFDNHSVDENEEIFKELTTTLDIKVGQLFMPLRVAVTGTKASPPLFSSIKLIGKDKAIERVKKALEVLR